MIPVTQTKVVVKNSAGEMVVRGNCWAACIASILEKTIDEIPNVETLFHIDDSYWAIVMHTYLRSIGYELYAVDSDKDLIDQYYIASGKSPRGVQHACVYYNGKIVHDPHPTREGILKPEYFEIIEKIEP